MAYIGKEPIVGNFQKCDAITVVNGQAAYTLQVSSTNVVPESANHMLVSLNGILQAPVTSFSVSGSTLTFASNLATGDVIDFVILLGNVLDLGTPSDATVTNAKLASDLISGETDIGGAIADADLFLLDDGAGGTLRKTAASRLKTYIGGTWNRLASTGAGTTESTTDINGYFTSDYDIYKLYIVNLIASGNTTLQLQVAATGSYTVQTGSDYNTSQNYNSANAGGLAVNGYNSTAQYELGHIGSSTNFPTTTEIVMFKPTSTSKKKNFHSYQLGNYDGQRYFQNSAGYWNSTTAITGIRIKVASGTITYDNMHLYGIKNS